MKWKTSDQTISWFKDRAEENTLSLEESYQRKPVWKRKERCYLIESILMNCPIPEIFVHRKTSAKGDSTYGVVDGQQRIRTLLKFVGLDDTDDEDNNFVLDQLDEDSFWFGKSYEKLSDDEKEAFWEYSLSVRTILTKDSREIRDMFVRLNRFQLPLKGQELRNARFTGAFGRIATELANDNFFAKQGIVTPALIRRMGDIELVGELLAGVMYGPQEGSRAKIDQLYRDFEEYEDEIPGQAHATETYKKTLALWRDRLGELAGRWRNKHDFYSLFVATAHFVRDGYELRDPKKQLIGKLNTFAKAVDRYIEDEKARIKTEPKAYARAVQKGPSSKARRAVRHQQLLKLLKTFFKPSSQ
jgi:hypothetical protein